MHPLFCNVQQCSLIFPKVLVPITTAQNSQRIQNNSTSTKNDNSNRNRLHNLTVRLRRWCLTATTLMARQPQPTIDGVQQKQNIMNYLVRTLQEHAVTWTFSDVVQCGRVGGGLSPERIIRRQELYVLIDSSSYWQFHEYIVQANCHHSLSTCVEQRCHLCHCPNPTACPNSSSKQIISSHFNDHRAHQCKSRERVPREWWNR